MLGFSMDLIMVWKWMLWASYGLEHKRYMVPAWMLRLPYTPKHVVPVVLAVLVVLVVPVVPVVLVVG